MRFKSAYNAVAHLFHRDGITTTSEALCTISVQKSTVNPLTDLQHSSNEINF